MNGLLLACLVGAFVWAIAGLYYHLAIRPSVVDQVRFSMFKIRDELRTEAIHERIDSKEFCFQHLEDMLNAMIFACPWVGVSTLIEFHLKGREDVVECDVERFDREATDALKGLENQALDRMLTVVAINSPGWVCVAMFLAFFVWLKKRLLSPSAKGLKTIIKNTNRHAWYDKAQAGQYAIAPSLLVSMMR